MNQFTKEELEEIISSFDWIEMETSWDWKHSLRNKIKSMIDNYNESKQIDGFAPHPTDYTDCHHKWQQLEFATKNVTPTFFCSKCRAIHFIRN